MIYKTHVRFERDFTSDELTSKDSRLAEFVDAGVTDGTRDDQGDRTWTTREAADSWIAFLNTFVPAPAVATVKCPQ